MSLAFNALAFSPMGRLIRAACCTMLLAPLLPAAAWSAMVTTNQTDMKTIFSQASFAGTPIDIRFQAQVTIADSALLSIDDSAELTALFAMGPAVTPGINLFFVDAVNYCGINPPLTTVLGCAAIGGNTMVVESIAAADTTLVNTIGTRVSAGSVLNAHELAHNLGLPHTSECTPSMPANLMDCQLMGADLTVSQVTMTLLNSALVQTDTTTGSLFVSITPVLIVPLPAAAWLLGSALGLLGLSGWRNRRLAY